MVRTPLALRTLPDYTRGEERFNMISHIAGGAFAIVVLVLCVVTSAMKGDPVGVAASAVYGATMILLYAMSSIYHGLIPVHPKKIMQVLDHCTIYFLIAGTYTPIALIAIREVNPALGWTLFGIEWGLAALAIPLTAIDHHKYGAVAMACYILMGWLVLPFWKTAVLALGERGFLLLLAGGILYTVGAVLYGLGKKIRYMHNVFHVFVFLGSLLQFLAILFYAL